VVTTASDEKGRDTVYTLLKGHSAVLQAWVAPVGRLDKASEGLLLLTNDSEWAARIVEPETHLDKTYHVQIGTVADEEFILALHRGIKARDGKVLRVKRARLLRAGMKNCWLEVVLDEGKNRHIRRMMGSLDVEVLRLLRVAIGPLQLGDLAKGQHRAVTADERRMLNQAMQGKRL
jgi:23S rRNA pseudouridine2605 synthase